MPTVQVLDGKGKQSGTLELSPEVFGVEVRAPLLHQAVTREQMAVFLLKAKNGAAFLPPLPGAQTFADVPLKDLRMGAMLLDVTTILRDHGLSLPPDLALMIKAFLTLEGFGRQLDPDIDIWAVARPVLEKILAERYSPQRLLGEFRKRLPEMVTHAPDMPQLLHAWLRQQVEGRHELAMRSRDVRDVAQQLAGLQRRVVAAILGIGLLLVAAVLYALDAGGPHWLGVPVSTWIAGLGGAWALLAAWPWRK